MIYIHIPFCKSFCTYCDFYSELALKSGQEFSKALNREICTSADTIKEHLDSTKLKTIYIGGGTPSVLPLATIKGAVDSLKACGYNPPYDEFTLEVNPEDIVEKGQDYVNALQDLGVNRISMGVQSFDDDILKWMNRRHTTATAIKAYDILEKAGVKNISIDLIFGLPQLDHEKWKATINQALNISQSGKPPHISSYQLSIERTSALAQMLENGEFVEAPDELCREQYDILCEMLAKAGYEHYEISNFALPGYKAIHNSAYWEHVPYIGFGPAAHSFLITNEGKRIRRWNAPDLKAYIEAGKLQDFSTVRGEEVLNNEQYVLEKIMLGLRTSKGVDSAFLQEYNPQMTNKFLEEGKLEHDVAAYIRIPESQFFISDSIIASLYKE